MSVRDISAITPYTPDYKNLFRMLSKNDRVEVLLAVADNPYLPLDILEEFLEGNNPQVILRALRNDNTTPRMMLNVLRRFEKGVEFPASVQYGLNLPLDVFKEIARSGRDAEVMEEVFLALLGVSETGNRMGTRPNDVLVSFEYIAMNPCTEDWILQELANWDLTTVKEAAAGNENTPPEVLEKLYDEGYYSGLLMNDAFPFERKMDAKFLSAIENPFILELFFHHHRERLTRDVCKLVYDDISETLAYSLLLSPVVSDMLTDEERSLLILEFGFTLPIGSTTRE